MGTGSIDDNSADNAVSDVLSCHSGADFFLELFKEFNQSIHQDGSQTGNCDADEFNESILQDAIFEDGGESSVEAMVGPTPEELESFDELIKSDHQYYCTSNVSNDVNKPIECSGSKANYLDNQDTDTSSTQNIFEPDCSMESDALNHLTPAEVAELCKLTESLEQIFDPELLQSPFGLVADDVLAADLVPAGESILANKIDTQNSTNLTLSPSWSSSSSSGFESDSMRSVDSPLSDNSFTADDVEYSEYWRDDRLFPDLL